MRKRQAEGIRMGKLNGVKLGRPSVAIPDDFVSIISLYKKGVINSKEAIEKSGLARGTFYRKLQLFSNLDADNI